MARSPEMTGLNAMQQKHQDPVAKAAEKPRSSLELQVLLSINTKLDGILGALLKQMAPMQSESLAPKGQPERLISTALQAPPPVTDGE